MLRMEEFVTKTLLLLTQEREAEIEESQVIVSQHLQYPDRLQSKGICLTKLYVSSQYIGLYGRNVVVFEQAPVSRNVNRFMPSTSISTGDIVGVFANRQPLSERRVSGIVIRKDNISISVAFDELDLLELDAHNGSLQIVKLSNDVTYLRMKSSLEELRSQHSHQHLVRVLFGEVEPLKADPRFSDILSKTSNSDKLSFYNSNLDESQQRAVVLTLSRPDVGIIHGPPGTGKTTTIVELILQSVKLGQKVLACAPSNIAVDNIVERLAKEKIRVVRLGHPARLSDTVQNLSLDALLKKADSAEIITDVRKDIKKALDSIRHSPSPGEKGKWRSEIRVLKKELQRREQRAIRELLKGADVILATTSGASLDGPLKHLPDGHFDMTIIDECAQAVEASCWIPILRAPKCVIAGDHKQLPPTILSEEAARSGLALSLMERLIQLHVDSITAMLTVQYRMHADIMSCSSKSFYGNVLKAHSSVSSHTLSHLQEVSTTNLTSIPLLFIETSGCSLFELETLDEQSKGNEGEADLVMHHLKVLLSAGVAPSQVAVIAPYSLQVDLIRKRLVREDGKMSEIEVHTVDGFQGREKEAIIVSFTRSNSRGECGFLNENRRTNVAVTRARRHLTLIGDSGTIMHEPFIREMVNYCHEFGEVWSAREYLSDSTFVSSSHYKQTPSMTICKPKEPKMVSTKDKVATSQKKNGHKPSEQKKQRSRAVRTFAPAVNKIEVSDSESLTHSLELNLMEFVDGPDELLKFSSDLTSNERRLIHEMCEKLNLHHVSKGQGKQRYIEVRKRRAEDKSSDKSSTHSESSLKQPPDTTSEIGTSYETLPPESHHPQEDIPSTLSHPKLPRKKYPKSKLKSDENDSEGLDTLLAEVAHLDSTCTYSKCRKSVKLISVNCTFCCKRFCIEHSLPEVHGCGKDAKRNARVNSRFKLSGGAAPTEKSSYDRTKLQKKLHDKLDKVSSKTRKPRKK